MLAVIIVYLAAQLGIGAWLSRRIGNESDYLVAGRRLGYGLATFSLFATWFGAETIVSGAGRAYERGFSFTSPEPFGYGMCLVIMGVVFARPLWRRQLTTLADLYRQRYSIGVERLAAIILIPSSLLWAGAQIRAFGHVVTSAAPDFSLDTAMVMAALFTMLYTAFGGLLADAMTDLVQGIILIGGLLVLALVVFFEAGGMAGISSAFAQPAAIGAQTAVIEAHWLDVLEAWAIPICGSVVATELVGRIVGTRSERVAANSSLAAGIMYMAVGSLPLLIGLLANGMISGIADSEQVVPTVARELLHPAFYALFACGLISAILSTVDSTLLVASGLLSHNLIVPVFRVTDERTKLLLARGAVLGFGVVAWLFARAAGGVFELVEEASALGSAGVLVTVTFALFTRFGGRAAAVATLLSGVLVYVGATIADSRAPFLLSFLASFCAYTSVALWERRRNPQ